MVVVFGCLGLIGGKMSNRPNPYSQRPSDPTREKKEKLKSRKRRARSNRQTADSKHRRRVGEGIVNMDSNSGGRKQEATSVVRKNGTESIAMKMEASPRMVNVALRPWSQDAGTNFQLL